jgi:hypothetical protein
LLHGREEETPNWLHQHLCLEQFLSKLWADPNLRSDLPAVAEKLLETNGYSILKPFKKPDATKARTAKMLLFQVIIKCCGEKDEAYLYQDDVKIRRSHVLVDIGKSQLMKCRHSRSRLGVQILGEDASGEGVGREVVNLAFAELATQCFSPRLHPITAAMAKLRGRCANTAASVQRARSRGGASVRAGTCR